MRKKGRETIVSSFIATVDILVVRFDGVASCCWKILLYVCVS